ncbi:MAG: rod shape-determining protein MreC [Candidatus Omnitrophica bacterium]|nr:rod shape-determining protein MreC [Candidatus Omnitrophota bacterium]
MFKLTRKKLKLIFFSFLLFVLLLVSVSIFKKPVTVSLKHPLSLTGFLRREIGGIIFYHRNLIENIRIKKEVDFLKNKINSLNEYYLENLRLKENLAFKNKSALKLIPARVISRSADNWSLSFTIDKGSYNGVARGMGVINYLGLVGRIVETASSTSKIMLLNDPNLGVSGIVQRSRQEGLISGTLGSNLIMKYLPEEVDIKIGDTIISSGLDNLYPKGILIGKVIEIGKELSGLSRYALIRPAVNFSNIEEVLVVVP